VLPHYQPIETDKNDKLLSNIDLEMVSSSSYNSSDSDSENVAKPKKYKVIETVYDIEDEEDN